MKDQRTYAIVSIATPDYAREWSFCVASHRRYCDAHGIKYLLFSGLDAPLHPKWSKLQYTLDALSRADGVMLLDADAEFSPACPHFGDLLDAQPEADILYANGVSGRLNSGVLIFRGGGSSVARAFLSRCLERRTTPVQSANFVTAEGENGHLIEIIQEEAFQKRSAVIPTLWNCTVPEGFQAAHIRHYTGPLRQALDSGRLPKRRPLASYSRLLSRRIAKLVGRLR
jgi:hypothetical protein